LQLTQDDLCGIFTGVYTNWNQTSANPGTQAITIVHRSDGSGTTFLFSYDMSQMCSAANPYTGPGKPVAAHYWGQPSNGKTQGVGTDSNVFGTAGPSGLYAGIPLDNNAPEVVWPATSVGASKSGGMLAAVNNSANAGYIGYISPSYVSQLTTGVATEANVENYAGNYEPANTMTVDASLGSSTTSAAQPAGYPAPNSTNILYWPFPTALTGDALVGYSYGYFYSCNAARLKDQVTAYVDLFKDIASTKIPSGASATVSDAAAHFWELDPLGSALKKNLATAVGDSKVAGSTGTIKGTYISPVDGFTKLKFSCTPV
jgi:ABC-type phosphate transport system substrate-binding protein